jgi:hypothetical protein
MESKLPEILQSPSYQDENFHKAVNGEGQAGSLSQVYNQGCVCKWMNYRFLFEREKKYQ